MALPVRRSPARVVQPAHKINQRITARVVRVVGEEIEAQVMSIQDALRLADSKELDLVEISPNADPPVCKIVD